MENITTSDPVQKPVVKYDRMIKVFAIISIIINVILFIALALTYIGSLNSKEANTDNVTLTPTTTTTTTLIPTENSVRSIKTNLKNLKISNTYEIEFSADTSEVSNVTWQKENLGDVTVIKIKNPAFELFIAPLPGESESSYSYKGIVMLPASKVGSLGRVYTKAITDELEWIYVNDTNNSFCLNNYPGSAEVLPPCGFGLIHTETSGIAAYCKGDPTVCDKIMATVSVRQISD